MHQSTTLRISIDLPMHALLARLVTADPAIEMIEREIALRRAARPNRLHRAADTMHAVRADPKNEEHR